MRVQVPTRWFPPLLVSIGSAVVLVAQLRGMLSLLVLAAIAIPVGRAIYERPQTSILILAIGLPYHGLRQVLPLPGSFDLWPLAVVLAGFGAAYLHPDERPVRPKTPGWLAAYGGMFLITLVGAFESTRGELAFGIRTMFFPVLVALIILRQPLDHRERDRLVTVLMVNGFITAVYGIVQQLIGHEGLRELGYRYNSNIRFSGNFVRSFSTFNQPFGYGFFLALVIIVGLALALEEPARQRSRLFLLAMPVIGLGLLTSVVRSAWIAAALGVLYLGFRRHRILLLAIPFGVVALLLAPTGNSSNVTSSNSANVRATSWIENIPTLLDNPLGVGIGRVGAAAGARSVAEGGPRGFQQGGLDVEGGAAYQPDNQYFKVALELGFPGLYLFLLVFVSAFLSARAVSVRAGPDGAWGGAVAGYVVGIAVGSISTMTFELPTSEFMIFVVLGVVATIPVSPSPDGVRVPRRTASNA